jgi:dephospho-CoA kinase
MTSLISISGKIGSGKDLTGKIIQAFLEFPP